MSEGRELLKIPCCYNVGVKVTSNRLHRAEGELTVTPEKLVFESAGRPGGAKGSMVAGAATGGVVGAMATKSMLKKMAASVPQGPVEVPLRNIRRVTAGGSSWAGFILTLWDAHVCIQYGTEAGKGRAFCLSLGKLGGRHKQIAALILDAARKAGARPLEI